MATIDRGSTRRNVRFCTILVLPAVLLLPFACGGGETPAGPDNGGGGPPVVTVDTIPPAAISGLVATMATAGWIALQWVAPGDDGETGTAAGYDIRYSTVPITGQNWDAATQIADEPAPNPGGQLQIHRVTGLNSVTQYYLAIKTRDEVPNESGLSNIATHTTLQEYVPPSAITDLNATAINDTTFLLTFTATGNNWNEGTASVYDVRYSVNTITIGNWDGATQVEGEPPPRPAGEPESLLVSGLLPDRNYTFAIKVADGVPNWSDLSNPAFTLGYSIHLWAYPAVVHKGEELTIVYRAPAYSPILIELFRGQILYDCGSSYLRLRSRTYNESGVYSMTFDCINPSTQEYIPTAVYTVSICIDGVRPVTGAGFRFEFMD